ncbi:unnamed protein product [Rhizoctonia solani]|uniref:NAD-dependent epimerase/dehydratase domain-containing protein n=1 Tax=Rhizoctonia solani TaxID=456999 RepID=A0A8H3GSD5_9AGAM|nr:unnamed protein product [Rhizoctonia solani]
MVVHNSPPFSATGYVGGSLLVSLVQKYPLTKITALVRNPEDLDAVSAVGPTVHVVLGSHTDREVIIRAVSDAELVVQISYSDDLELVKAIVVGLKLHKEKTGKRALYFHATGTMTYAGEASGELRKDYEVWDDRDKNRLRKKVDINAPHRRIDLEAIRAHDQNVADVYVICPPVVYGLGTGPVRRINGQITHAVRIFLEMNHAVYVGKGTNIWSHIHIRDLIQAILTIIDHAIRTQNDTPEGDQTAERDGFDNFYFTSAGEHTWGSVIEEIARTMFQRGLLKCPSLESVSEEYNRILSWNVGSNCRVRSARLEALGWRPKETSIIDNIEECVEASLQLIKSDRVLNFWLGDY